MFHHHNLIALDARHSQQDGCQGQQHGCEGQRQIVAR